MLPLLRQNAPRQTSFSKLPISLLQLPPGIRTRSFHATPQPRIYDALTGSAHSLLESLHGVSGLPWVYTLPLSALIIRTTFVLPVSIYTRRRLQKRAELDPLVNAWQHTLRKETMQEVGHLGPRIAQSTALKKMRRKRIEIYKRWGCQNWKVFWLSLTQLPVFLVVIEAVRKMCGSAEGLFGMGTHAIQNLFRSAEPIPGAEAVDTAAMPGQLLVQGVQIEPSLATEGALWFPNLLVADPQLVLPFMLSGVILMNLFGKLPNAAAAVPLSKWQIRLPRILGAVALCIGPLTLQVPSAMLLYWISSSTFAYLQAVILDVIMPIKRPIQPCKPERPLKVGGG